MLMLPSPLRAPLTVLIAYVAVVSAAPAVSTVPSLAVRTSTSNVNIDKLDDLKVTATIVNTGDGTLKLLNDPRGVLNPFPENSFTVTDSSGSHPPFTGHSVDYDPVHDANLDHPDTFTVLAPGGSIDVTHDLPAAYSFTQSGRRDYFIEPSNLFTYIDADGTPKDLYATVEGIAKVKLSGHPAISRHVHDKRIKSKLEVDCKFKQQQIVERAIRRAQDVATAAYSSLKSKTVPDAYKTWFGAYDSKRKRQVRANFGEVGDILQKFTYQCGCSALSEEFYADRFGFYYEERTPRKLIRICKKFWKPSSNQKEAMIHLALMYFSLVDHKKDKDWSRQEASTDPMAAIKSQANYIFFAQAIQQGEPS